MKKALFIAAVSGFLMKFELQDVRLLQQMGYEIHYAANFNVEKYEFDKDELAKNRIQIHQIPIAKSPYRLRDNLETLRELERIIRKEGIRLIHCHTPTGGALGRLAGHRCRDMDVKVIYTAHGFHFYRGCPLPDQIIYRSAERYLAHNTDAIVLINQEDYENAKTFHLKKEGRVYRIPGVGLDRARFRPLPEGSRHTVRKELGVADNQTLFLSIGELNKNKNHLTVLRALCRMREQGIDLSRFCYVICGEGSNREMLEQKIAEWKLQQTVTLYGYCSDLERLYAASDLFFFPSRREGLGMAALEALSCGTPVAAAENRGSREYIIPGKNGWFCRWDQPEDYIAAFQKWDSLTDREKRQMRKVCRDSVERFEQKYSEQIMRAVYEQTDSAIRNTGGEKDEPGC